MEMKDLMDKFEGACEEAEDTLGVVLELKTKSVENQEDLQNLEIQKEKLEQDLQRDLKEERDREIEEAKADPKKGKADRPKPYTQQSLFMAVKEQVDEAGFPKKIKDMERAITTDQIACELAQYRFALALAKVKGYSAAMMGVNVAAGLEGVE